MSFHSVSVGKMIGRLINQGQVVIFGSLLASVQVYYTTFVITDYVYSQVCFSFKFNFGNDPTVSAPDKGLCCKPTNIGKNGIMYFLYFVCTSFLFSFRRSVPSILSFQLIQIFFWEPDVATSSLACEEVIPCCWLLVGMFQHKEPPNHRKPNDWKGWQPICPLFL